MTTREQRNGLERHAQTIVGAVVLALVLWVGKTLNEQNLSIAVLNERVVSMQQQLSVFANFMKEPRFTENDYKEKMVPFSQRMDFLEMEMTKRLGLLRDMEERLRRLESKSK